jgi:hypothetical protein
MYRATDSNIWGERHTSAATREYPVAKGGGGTRVERIEGSYLGCIGGSC